MSNENQQHWYRAGNIACGAVLPLHTLETYKFFETMTDNTQNKYICTECRKLYEKWWNDQTQYGYTIRLKSAAKTAVSHWNEFGPGADFDREIDNLRRIVEERP